MQKITQLILFVLVFPAMALSQIIRPRDKAEVIFSSSVYRDSSSAIVYAYTITNKVGSTGACDNFCFTLVDSMLTSNITKVAQQSNKKWYIDGVNTGYIDGAAANRFVDLPIPPEDALFPDETMSISFKSSGLPAIVPYYAQSFSVPFNANEEDSLHALGYTSKQISPDWKENSYKNQTVAPNTTLLNLLPSTLLDSIISFTNQSTALGWIRYQAISNKYLALFATLKTSIESGNNNTARGTIETVIADAIGDSTTNITSEAYALIRFNTEYLLAQLPEPPPPGLNVMLINSTGTNLTSGSLQYYDGTWKDATNNNDGTFSITTSLKTLSLRMTYEGGSQTKSNVTLGPDPVVFQTVNAQVKLQNSVGNLMDQGSVQFYAGSWRSFGVTSNGIATKELLPGSYSFRMTYAYGSKDLQQNIGTNAVVVFQTVNSTVQLKNNLGALIDQGTVQYYAGTWRTFGATTGGSVSKELLPVNYSFRMTYEGVSNDKAQDLSTNNTVGFSTVLCTIRVKNGQSQPVDNALVSYYSTVWKQIGLTVNGQVTKELLPANLTFRMTLGTVSQDKAQNIGTNGTVEFVTQ